MKINILMPMGGLGMRFREAGYETPKPLIKVDGKPMFQRAFESFPSQWEINPIFVVRKDQNAEYGLASYVQGIIPQARIALLEKDTRGCVETCLLAEKHIEPDLPLIVADCDLRFKSSTYCKAIESNEYDGFLLGFDSQDNRYSYAELDENGNVVRTAEKVPISNHALLGGYYFRSGVLFLDKAHEFVAKDLSDLGLKEYYVSHLYNMLLDDKLRIGFAEANSFDCWGTPEEYESYLKEC